MNFNNLLLPIELVKGVILGTVIWGAIVFLIEILKDIIRFILSLNKEEDN